MQFVVRQFASLKLLKLILFVSLYFLKIAIRIFKITYVAHTVFLLESAVLSLTAILLEIWSTKNVLTSLGFTYLYPECGTFRTNDQVFFNKYMARETIAEKKLIKSSNQMQCVTFLKLNFIFLFKELFSSLETPCSLLTPSLSLLLPPFLLISVSSVCETLLQTDPQASHFGIVIDFISLSPFPHHINDWS